MSHITIYTDGACKGNPGPGGWGVLLHSDGTEQAWCGGERQTTNNRMELMAVIEALTRVLAQAAQPCTIALHLDSQYVRQGITSWIHNWKARGWVTASRTPVKNADLWRRLDALVQDCAAQRHHIDWRWVRGHAGDAGNERADALANQGVQQVLAAA